MFKAQMKPQRDNLGNSSEEIILEVFQLPNKREIFYSLRIKKINLACNVVQLLELRNRHKWI